VVLSGGTVHSIACATMVIVSYNICAVPPYIGCSIGNPTLDGMNIGEIYFFPSNSNSVPSRKERFRMDLIDMGRTADTSSGFGMMVIFCGKSARYGWIRKSDV